MKANRLSPILFAAANLCLMASAAVQKQWIWLALVLLLIILWPIQLKARPAWMSHALFFTDLALLIYTGIYRAIPLLLIFAICFLIAAWETANRQKPAHDTPLANSAVKFENRRLILLASALGIAAVIAGMGSLISISLPFLVELLIGIAILVSLVNFYTNSR